MMAPEELDVAARLAVHEAVCAERYKNLNDNLNNLQSWVKRATGLVVSAMGTMLGFLIWHYINKP